MDTQTMTALSALEFPFLHTRSLFDRGSRNLLTAPYDEPKLGKLDFDAPPSPIYCFWSGPKPNEITQLALRSFVHHGHAVCLYTYDAPAELAAQVPAGVAVRDAGEIVARPIFEECLARSEVRYFSDIFRYATLYRFGGWWIDTDVVLLRPLPAVSRYFFCTQWSGFELGHLLVGDVLYAPKSSHHFLQLYRMSLANMRGAGSDLVFGAVGPRLLTDYVLMQQDLKQDVFSPTLFNSIDWDEIDLFRAPSSEAFELVSDPRVIGLHLWNKGWVDRNLTPVDAQPGSVARHLLDHYSTPNRLAELALRHGSDRGPNCRGAPANNYTRIYQDMFETRMLQPMRIMEVGLSRGSFEGVRRNDIPNVRMWLDFFPNATVFGVDNKDFSWYSHERVRIFRADRSSEQSLLENVVSEIEDAPLDVIIDDGSQVSWDQQVTFRLLFPRLARGGIYIIENLDRQKSILKSATTKTLLELFSETGRLSCAAWLPEEAEAFAAAIESVEFHDSYTEPANCTQHGGVAVIRKRRL